MVSNCYIKCRVCGSITRVRLQIGFLEEHPIIVVCGECGTSLSGTYYQNNSNSSISFKNADIITDTTEDFVVEVSGEFVTFKHNSQANVDSMTTTPFMRNISRFSSTDDYNNFIKDVINFLRICSDWSHYETLVDLWFNGKIDYFKKEVRKIIPPQLSACRNEFELLRAIHLIEIHCFAQFFKKTIIASPKDFDEIMILDQHQTSQLIDFLNNHNGFSLSEMQKSIFNIYSDFIKVFSNLIPAYSLQFLNNEIDYEKEGSSISDFLSTKSFYQDLYETLGNLIIIPVALNNIKYRKDYNTIKPIANNINNLEDFIKQSKGIRYKYCVDNELYTKLLDIDINNKARNGIGHNDVEYDAITQKLTIAYNPKNRNNKVTQYLIQYENDLMHMFQAIIVISEYLYQLIKIEQMNKLLTKAR